MPTTFHRTRCGLGALTIALIAASGARGAGGHHAVDDTALLEPGQCQIESWIDRETTSGPRLLHAGLGCRAAGLELGLNLDRTRDSGSSAHAAVTPQLKWALPLSDAISVGAVLSATGHG